jgi:hypothetical protein
MKFAIAWIFLVGAALAGVAIPLMYMNSVQVTSMIAYLKAAGTLYSAPLGVIVASLFGAKVPIDNLDRKRAAFALAAAVMWNAFPVALGAFGAFAKPPAGFDTFCDYLQQSAIPVNTAITAILASLFPKAKEDADQGSS